MYPSMQGHLNALRSVWQVLSNAPGPEAWAGATAAGALEWRAARTGEVRPRLAVSSPLPIVVQAKPW